MPPIPITATSAAVKPPVASGGAPNIGATSVPTTSPTTRPTPVWALPRPAPAPGVASVEEIQRVFDYFLNALAKKKGFSVDAAFDGDRIVREIQTLDFLKGGKPEE